MARGLRVVSIEDLEINFPFEPYEIQKDLMRKVIECIKTRSNGLLESPTGTGKTLSLLCAALAWQTKEKKSYRMLLKTADTQLSLQSSNAVKAVFEPPKIIYASRTHSQLTQAVLELKRSHYRTSKAVVLGSRDLLCIHEEVQRIQNSTAKIMACHAKIQRHICTYHNNVQQKKEDSIVRDATVVDIEDIVQKGRQGRFCPFFMSRELVKDADIVFMPYNYILDPKIRSSHGIDLKNSIIILDEGHNIPKLCEEAVSFEIRSSLIAMCILELTKALNEFKDKAEGEHTLGVDKDLSLQVIARLKQIFLNLETELDKIEGKEIGYLMNGEGFIEILSQCGFSTQRIPHLAAELDGVGTFLTGSNIDATGCDKFGSILRVLSSNSLAKNFGESYKVYVELELKKDIQRDFRVSELKPSKIFNFWCFNPAVGLETLSRFGPRSIILASGTLSPISFLREELMIPFPVELSNPHIICDNQLFVGVFKTGPKNVTLSSTYENRNRPEYLEDLGEVVLKMCSVVPAGILVFFPSYAVMESCTRAWREKGTMNSIQQYKKVFVEPRGSDSFKQVLQDYYTAVRNGGGCLMAVCRGKVSEGLDFTDDYGRGVILTGIPYSPAMDPKIIAKKNYLDGKVRSGSNLIINGRKWYQLEACRALNQAVGRIIRHAHDYGAILFCDTRCDDMNVQMNLSQWVVGRLKSYGRFDEGLRDLAKFFGSSLKQERKQVQLNFIQKQKEANVNYSKLPATPNIFMNDTYEDLLSLYSTGVPTEMSEGRKNDGNVKNVGSSKDQMKKPSDKSTLFEDIAANPTQKQVNFNFIVPAYSQVSLIPKKKTSKKTAEEGNSRKKIKIVSSVGKFSSLESRDHLINENEEKLTAFTSTSEFWQWVKLSLTNDNYSKFIRGIKKFKENQNSNELGEEVVACFKTQFRPQCVQGMSLFLTKEQLDQLKQTLSL